MPRRRSKRRSRKTSKRRYRKVYSSSSDDSISSADSYGDEFDNVTTRYLVDGLKNTSIMDTLSSLVDVESVKYVFQPPLYPPKASVTTTPIALLPKTEGGGEGGGGGGGGDGGDISKEDSDVESEESDPSKKKPKEELLTAMKFVNDFYIKNSQTTDLSDVSFKGLLQTYAKQELELNNYLEKIISSQQTYSSTNKFVFNDSGITLYLANDNYEKILDETFEILETELSKTFANNENESFPIVVKDDGKYLPPQTFFNNTDVRGSKTNSPVFANLIKWITHPLDFYMHYIHTLNKTEPSPLPKSAEPRSPLFMSFVYSQFKYFEYRYKKQQTLTNLDIVGLYLTAILGSTFIPLDSKLPNYLEARNSNLVSKFVKDFLERLQTSFRGKADRIILEYTFVLNNTNSKLNLGTRADVYLYEVYRLLGIVTEASENALTRLNSYPWYKKNIVFAQDVYVFINTPSMFMFTALGKNEIQTDIEFTEKGATTDDRNYVISTPFTQQYGIIDLHNFFNVPTKDASNLFYPESKYPLRNFGIIGWAIEIETPFNVKSFPGIFIFKSFMDKNFEGDADDYKKYYEVNNKTDIPWDVFGTEKYKQLYESLLKVPTTWAKFITEIGNIILDKL